MSRRKQHKPRHFDSVPGEEDVVAGQPPGPATMAEGPLSGQCLDTQGPLALDSRDHQDLDELDHADSNLGSPIMPHDDQGIDPHAEDPPEARCDPPEEEDSHICKVCCAEFFDLSDYLDHRKLCVAPEKQSVLYFDEDLEKPVEPTHPDSPLHHPLSHRDPDHHHNAEIDEIKKDAIMELQSLTQGGTTDYHEPDLEAGMARSPGMTRSPGSEVLGYELAQKALEEARIEGYADEELEEEEEEDYDEEAEYDEYEDLGEPENPSTSGVFPAQFPVGLSPQVQLSMMQASCNVKLQSLENTKVAVAQFAENNINPSDIASLQNTLYSLQQQQMFQLQLLQQIQQQIMTTGLQSLPPATIKALSSGMLPTALPNMAAIAQMAMSQNPPSASESVATSTVTTATNSNASSSLKPQEGSTSLPAVTSTSIATSVSMATTQNNAVPLPGRVSSSPSSNSPVTKATSSTVTPSSQGLPAIPPLSSIGAPIFSTVVPEMSQLCSVTKGNTGSTSSSNSCGGTALDRSQYAAEDPFFKHKCRFCHKVFGSDSALQIHIRSHTGERPFKCNVCGNRFSTKGNLKVHFQRHKEKYPHLEMNGIPFPEHLDTSPAPPVLMPSPQGAANLQPPLLPPTSIPPPLIPMAPLMPTRDPEKPLSKMEPDIKVSASPMQQLSAMTLPPITSMEEKLSPRFPTTIKQEPETKAESKESSSPSVSAASGKSTPCTPAATPTSSMATSLASTPPRSTPNRFPGPFQGPIPGSIPGPIPGINFHMNHLNTPPPGMSPFGFESHLFAPRPSILPPKVEDPMEQYMEVQKSETSKLEALVKNIETKLTDPNQCAICHRILSCKSALQMHYRTHTGERPFKCKICSRAFTTKGNLKTHMGVHRAKPPLRMMHQCPVCHKQFTNALVLQQHIRMHTGELPKEMPLPGGEIMMPGPLNYMPFPGFPFFPPSMPPPHPALGMELDLRKHHKMMPGDLSNKSDHDKRSEGSNSLLQHSGDRSSEDAHHDDSMEDLEEDLEDMDMDEPERSLAMEGRGHDMPSDIDDSNSPGSRDITPKFSLSGSDQSDQDMMKMGREKRSFGHMTSTPQPAKRFRSESPSSKPIMDFQSYGPIGEESRYPPTSSYSTSLMALEDHVKAIDSMESNKLGIRPLEQMENIVKRADGRVTPPSSLGIPNGHHSNRTSPAMPRLPQEGRHTPRGLSPLTGRASPALSESNASHASMDSSRFSEANLMNSPNSHLKLFGPMDLTSSAFEAATGKPHTTCDICFKTFACKSALDIHYRSHTKERPYFCDVCERSFTTRGNMKQHMLTHKIRDLPEGFNSTSNHSSSSESAKDVTPPASIVSVPPVQPALSSSSSMNHPKTSPEASKPNPSQSSPFVRQPSLKHVCNVCNKPFSSASALQIHMRTHTGDKPFKCNVCGKAFTTKGNLKVHMGTHMWNNGPSRRGRRMSVEGIPGLQMPPRDAEFFKAFAHRPPAELFPFPYPGFHNGFGPKLNEISVIQSLNGSMSHLPPTSAAESMMNHMAMLKGGALPPHAEAMLKGGALPPHSEALLKTEAMLKVEESLKSKDSNKSETNNNSYPPVGSSGELDLSVKKTPKPRTPPPAEQKLQRVDQKSEAQRLAASELSPHSANPWLWKTTCHLCNQVCPSQSALEMHMKSHLPRSKEESTPKSVMT